MSVIVRFLTVRGIPKLFWSAADPLSLRPPLISFVFLTIGLVIFGAGEAMIIAAGLGVTPWTVLAQGIAAKAGWSIGTATFMVSIAVLLFWVPLRQKPGVGTVMNAIIIAVVMDIMLAHLPRPQGYALQLAMMAGGICAVGFGSAVYLIANLGPGARDGLMTSLQRLTALPILAVRGGLELVVVCSGWVLGGTIGLGTACFAVGIGMVISVSAYGLKCCFTLKS